MRAASTVSRRDLLKTGGAIIVSFALGATLPKRSAAQTGQAAGSDLGKPLDTHEVDSFLAVHADGSVTLYTSHVDVGTGLRVAMPQMAAEESALLWIASRWWKATPRLRLTTEERAAAPAFRAARSTSVKLRQQRAKRSFA